MGKMRILSIYTWNKKNKNLYYLYRLEINSLTYQRTKNYEPRKTRQDIIPRRK